MAALIWLSIVVVQPAMAVGLLVLLAVATRMLSERPGRRDVLATVAVAAGIAVLTAGAPEPSHRPSGELRLVIALGTMAVVVVLPYVLQQARQGGPAMTVLGAGVGYAASGLGTALTADAIQRHADLAALGWAGATAAAGGAALLAEMSALQDWPATRVAPLVFTVQTVLPVALAPWLLGAAVSRPGWAPASFAALLVVLAGACVLSRSSAVLRITTAGC